LKLKVRNRNCIQSNFRKHHFGGGGQDRTI
jgi:hypothetical protein